MHRRGIMVRGTVQGVGFRPFVYGLAARFNLHGFVKNQAGGVRIEVEGEQTSVDRFIDEIVAGPPRLAHIVEITCEMLELLGENDFRIDSSDAAATAQVFVSADVATCDDCLAELFDVQDRRFGYPFLNCTSCGPRLTIMTGAPYDRQRTTMAGFPLCDECRVEYHDPHNRRFHAQPIACPKCGPQLELKDSAGLQIANCEPLAGFAAALRAGKIGAIKGLGGYHLACDASNESAVAELRRRKHRDEKPFAVMVRDVAAAEALCQVAPAERGLLLSSRRPIVLLRRRRASRGNALLAESVAPGNALLGIMLPYTPLHHLLLQSWGEGGLVLTSGNAADEPIAIDDGDALWRLAGIADLFLTHNRPIRVRCDDSVTRIVAGSEVPIRRSRGYAPRPIELPVPCSCPILAVGGQFKATFALADGRHAFLSQHLGDLDHYEAYRAFEKDIRLYQDLFEIRPELIVHDLHPEYASTQYARKRAGETAARDSSQKLLAVQHHHAHIASCMAENGLVEPVIGVAFDGTGFGTDGAIWGGEFLVGDLRHMRRAAHLRYVGMPGGDQAVKQPWRMAAAHLLDAGCGLAAIAARVPKLDLRTIETMLERQFNTPLTSSMGRLFDAVAAIIGLRDCVSYEGQAAVQLEWLATDAEADDVASRNPESHEEYPFELTEQQEADVGKRAGISDVDCAGSPPGLPCGPAPAIPSAGSALPTLIVDTRPLIRAVALDVACAVEPRRIARRFHSSIAGMVVDVCQRLRTATGLNAVALSGGVFMNALLARQVTEHLHYKGFQIYRHHLVPPNDGGLSLGQLAIAAQHEMNAHINRPISVTSASSRHACGFAPHPPQPSELTTKTGAADVSGNSR